ncbi:hypothetical protein WJX73_000039 [Symbiochloris irregularis]|uniref:RidA family protein n=1 Tax=Symbiochloris irregularis TaxID=706552 RepID=A0AAW1NL69_9CHLO
MPTFALTLALALVVSASGQGLVEGPVAGRYALDPAPNYSEAVVAGNLAFLSGTGGDAETIEEAVMQTMMSLNDTLATLGASVDNAVSARVFLSNISNWAAMNPVYRSFFTGSRPARTAIQAELVGGGLVEIDMIAVLPNGAPGAASA